MYTSVYPSLDVEKCAQPHKPHLKGLTLPPPPMLPCAPSPRLLPQGKHGPACPPRGESMRGVTRRQLPEPG